MTQVHHSDPFSQNLPKVIFSDTFVKNKHLSLLNNVYITWKLDLAPFQGLSVDKTWFCSLHPPCGQDSVGPLQMKEIHKGKTNIVNLYNINTVKDLLNLVQKGDEGS